MGKIFELAAMAMNTQAEGVLPDEHSPDAIFDEPIEDSVRIDRLERKVQHLSEQLNRQIAINDGFIKMFEKLTK